MYQSRMQRELLKMNSNPIPGIYCHQKNEDKFDAFTAFILGQKDTPYENGKFELSVVIPEKYPFAPPLIKFVTPIYHPNIDEAGRICLDILKMPPQGSWMPRICIENLLVAIQMLMGSPNPDDPLIPAIAEEYKTKRDVFEKKAREYTLKHAVERFNKTDQKTTQIDIGDKGEVITTENKNTEQPSKKQKLFIEHRTEIGQSSNAK